MEEQKATSGVLQLTPLPLSDISAEPLLTKPVSQDEKTNLSALLARLEDTKSALEKEATLPNEEEKIAFSPSNSSSPALQFTKEEASKHKPPDASIPKQSIPEKEPLKKTGHRTPRQ